MTTETDTHILVVDDDMRIRDLLKKFLSRNGYRVTTARDAAHARSLLEGLEFDLIVLDVMMPGEDGFTLTAAIRDTITTPVLLLTAKGGAGDRIKGLEAGADDYLPKPFEPRELLLRMNVILRRMPQAEARPAPPKTITLGELRYDIRRGELSHGAEAVRLTATEIALMQVFCEHLHEPVSRTDLVEQLSAGSTDAQERAIDVQVTRLRRKIEKDPKAPRYLQTVRGCGYRLSPD